MRRGRERELAAQLPRGHALADDPERVGVAEGRRQLLWRDGEARQHRRPTHAQEQRPALDLDEVTGDDAIGLTRHTVDQERRAADVRDREHVEIAVDRQVRAR